MIKNTSKQLEVYWELKLAGNWNFRTPQENPLFTKPIAVVHIDQDEFVFQHADIMELIKAYHEADKKSIEMIRQGQAGLIKTFETPLLEKLRRFIKELNDQDCCIQNSPYQKDRENGQKALRLPS